MSKKTREVSQLANATYAHTLVIKSTHEHKVHGPYPIEKFSSHLGMNVLENTPRPAFGIIDSLYSKQSGREIQALPGTPYAIYKL